jgi:Uroporphyrinogen decarboxylase (URO-D)
VALTHREKFFRLFEDDNGRYMPFFPDITTWYMTHRLPPGTPQPFGPGQYIPNAAEIHKLNHNMPDQYRELTLLDIYKKHDWGFPVHIYDWCEFAYSAPVRREETLEADRKTITLDTPKGRLTRVDLKAEDGSFTPTEHFIKELKDLEILRLALEHQQCIPHYERVSAVLEELDGQGVGDIPVMRCPFGKLIQEYMGFEAVVFALYDNPQVILDFMVFQEELDLEQVRLAAASPAKIVIISDHADENLIAPPYYREYCIPFYNKACEILHRAGKIVSTHLDGNFKGHMPLLGKTGFDLLDGCTPAPMNNYEVEELAEALPAGQLTYLGVPATLFCQGLEASEILAFGERIHRALAGRAILNVGDILPPNGDIEQVVALGEHLKALNDG